MNYKTPEEISDIYFSLSDEEKHNFEWFDYIDPEDKKKLFGHTGWSITKYKTIMRQYLPDVCMTDLYFYYENDPNTNEKLFCIDINYKDYGGKETENGKKHMYFGEPFSLSQIKKTKENDILKIIFELNDDEEKSFDNFTLKPLKK